MGVFPSDAQGVYAALASKDKALELIPGAHYFEDDEAKRIAMIDLISAWISARKLTTVHVRTQLDRGTLAGDCAKLGGIGSGGQTQPALQR